MKQTAIEWLEKQFEESYSYINEIFKDTFEKAKELERQQIFDCWDNGFDNGNFYGKYNENCEVSCGEQYYNETFKKE